MGSSDKARRGQASPWLWRIGLGTTAGVLLLFMVLPVFALVVTLRWDEFVSGLAHPSVMPALWLSLKTTLISLIVVVALGTPLAWVFSRAKGRWLSTVEAFVRLPVVLPPAVAGVALLLAFGRMGLLGGVFSSIGIDIAFSTIAVVLAQVFVAAPFYLQAATSAFRNIDEAQLVVARSLGASPARVFFRVALPACRPALIAGGAIAWARALGEFGATLMFAGNLTGETQTLTLAIYTAFESDIRVAQSISVVMVVVAFSILWILTRRYSPIAKNG